MCQDKQELLLTEQACKFDFSKNMDEFINCTSINRRLLYTFIIYLMKLSITIVNIIYTT